MGRPAQPALIYPNNASRLVEVPSASPSLERGKVVSRTQVVSQMSVYLTVGLLSCVRLKQGA